MFPKPRAWIALLALFAAPAAALGAEPLTGPFTYTDINTEVPGHPGLYYLDLLRQLVPDLKPNETIAKGTTTVMPVPHILGKPFMSRLPATLTFASFETRILQAEGQRRLLILTPVGLHDDPNEPMLLLAFSDDATPRLLDVIDVSLGLQVTVGQPIRIGARDEAIVTSSEYQQGTDTYGSDAIVYMRDGKFDGIGGFFRYDDIICGFGRTQKFSVATQPATGPYDDIKASISDTGALVDNNCDPSVGLAPYTTTYSALYHWDDASNSFVGDTAEMDALKDLTGPRFKPSTTTP